MKSIQGDLLAFGKDGTFDVIIHGCNCQNTMGAGIAKSMKRMFPAACKADQATRKGDRKKLGTYSSAVVELDGHTLTIVNAYTQFHFGGAGVRADYNALRKVFALVKQDFSGRRIGYPMIGAGLARGDWGVISKIIEEELEGEDHTLVRYVPR